MFNRVPSCLLLWCPFVWWPFVSCPLLVVASRIDSTVLPNFVELVSFDVMWLCVVMCVVGAFEKHSEFLPPRPKRGKKLFSPWSWALISFGLAHVNAFMNDFLKLSLRNAYRIGFMAVMDENGNETEKSVLMKIFTRSNLTHRQFSNWVDNVINYSSCMHD